MSTYLEGYGAGDAKRNRTIRTIIFCGIAALLSLWILYLIFHNFSEKRAVEHFLTQVNARDYHAAYTAWGCSEAAPCTNYDYKRFLEDWGPGKNAETPWKIVSVDGCKSFVTVNVQSGGSDVQSLGVERGTKTLMYAPAPECQEPQWRWKQFFSRLFGGGAKT